MKRETFLVLRRSLYGDVDKQALRAALEEETDPFVKERLLYLLGLAPYPVWETSAFTDQFRSVPPRERMEETVVTFLLKMVAIVKSEIYNRSLSKPYTITKIFAWNQLIKAIFFSVFSLLYDVKWTPSHLLSLDETLLELLEYGKPDPLRNWMREVGIERVRPNEWYRAERMFEKLDRLNTMQFGSFYWRLLHWMAEAMNVRPHQPVAKRMWRDLCIGPLYRTLRCGVCMYHLQSFVSEMQSQLRDESQDYAQLWFEIHNKVNAKRREAYPMLKNGVEYSAEDYRADAEFMRRALTPP